MPNTYMLKREIPADTGYDVLVAGGGPAGCTAAIAAAREGARVLLIEATGMLGGMGTAGLVPAWCPFTDKERVIYSGLAEQIFMASKCTPYNDNPKHLDWVTIDPEELKQIYDRMVVDAGVEILFFTQVCGVETGADGSIEEVLLANKAGLSAARARVYVDCTGDGDLSAWAGAPFEKGDPESPELQPSTHCFALTGVDEKAFREGPSLHGGSDKSPVYDIIESGKYPDIPDNHMCNNLQAPGTVGFNAGHLWLDATDPKQLSKAMPKGRALARTIRDALAEFVPDAFGNARVVKTAPLLGVRETRRIIGDYVLTKEDYIARRSFDDEIARNCYFVDIHTKWSEKDMDQREAFKAHKDRQIRYEKGESHGIPYRCLTAKGIPNVLVAGRCISTDRVVQGSTRVMPVALVMGEAAGLAAAMALNSAGAVRDVDVPLLQKKLKSYGAYLPNVD